MRPLCEHMTQGFGQHRLPLQGTPSRLHLLPFWVTRGAAGCLRGFLLLPGAHPRHDRLECPLLSASTQKEPVIFQWQALRTVHRVSCGARVMEYA